MRKYFLVKKKNHIWALFILPDSAIFVDFRRKLLLQLERHEILKSPIWIDFAFCVFIFRERFLDAIFRVELRILARVDVVDEIVADVNVLVDFHVVDLLEIANEILYLLVELALLLEVGDDDADLKFVILWCEKG